MPLARELACRLRHGAAVLVACALGLGGGHASADTPYRWNLPAWVPKPLVPADNALTQQKVELGRYLFYDRRLSVTGAMACAGCHEQARAFTDGRRVGIGATGEAHPRNAMGLANVAYFSALTWANPALTRLEEQAATPMFGTHPVEMGLAGREADIERLLRHDARYARMFGAAFPADPAPWTTPNLQRALASFQRTLVSFDSPYDRYRYGGDARAISPAAKRGETLFFSERLECFHCHGGITFSDAVAHERLERPEFGFHNTGLYNIDGRGAYPADNQGVKEKTGLDADMGRFRTPSLRNVAVTAPYMHDGSIPTLAAVLEHYRAGGRTIGHGPNRGIGAANPGKSMFVKGFPLSRRQKADLIAFLESLTDRRFLADPAHADPFEAAGAAARAAGLPR